MTTENDAPLRGVFTGPDGVKRRTILAGAAWSIPVVTVVTSAPATAATNDLTLAFDKSSYDGKACGTISGAYVTATRNGVVAAGESVTVTLADGYTFKDGSTSYTGTTDANGKLTLPDIKVPGTGGDSTATATSGSASTTAALKTPSGARAFSVFEKGTPNALGNVPAGSTPLNSGYFLKGSSLYQYNSSTAVATDVSKTSTGWTGSDGNHIYYTDTSGNAHSVFEGNAPGDLKSVPKDATPLNSGYFLKGSTLYYNDGTVLATDVASTSTGWSASDGNHIQYISTSGAAYGIGEKNKPTAFSSVPSGATALNSGYFLKDNTLYYIDGTKLAENVSKTSTGWSASDGNHVYYTDTSGKAHAAFNKTTSDLSSVPSGSTPLNSGYFLKDKVLYWNDGTKITDGVESTSTGWTAKDGNHLYFTKSTCS